VSTGRVDPAVIAAAVEVLDAGGDPGGLLGPAVRGLLGLLRTKAPGSSVEVRVPPYGVIQCVPGPVHTRGTPPNVVETDPVTFVLLATGRLAWAQAVGLGRVSASGIRADLSEYLPCWSHD
jgi:hypothetical protein